MIANKMNTHNYDLIKSDYLKAYKDALAENSDKLPTYIEPWFDTSNEIEIKFLSDIKEVGLLLYPCYPVDDFFVSFGNPFKNVAIIIVYKTTDKTTLQFKVDYLKKTGWNVFTIESRSVTDTAEELYNRVGYNQTCNFYELDSETHKAFINEYKYQNAQCLLYTIKEEFFN